jgi:hypothetical protein
MKRDLDSGFQKPGVQAPRKSARVQIGAMVKLRRRGHHNFTVQVFDLSREGCKLEFLERPQLDESVWVKFEGLEILEATSSKQRFAGSRTGSSGSNSDGRSTAPSSIICFRVFKSEPIERLSVSS